MDYFIMKHHELSDRNQLDKAIREWAGQRLHHLYVSADHMYPLSVEVKRQVEIFNAAFPYVKNKIEFDVIENGDTSYLYFSPCLRYVAFGVVQKYKLPF